MNLSIKKLRTLRSDNNWSQEVVAQLSGLSVRTIQRIESNGKASDDSAKSIAETFEVDVEDLLAKSGEFEASWSMRDACKNFVAVSIVLGAIYWLIFLARSDLSFQDTPSILYIIMFLAAGTIVSFGVGGAMKSVRGLKYLLTDEMYGGEHAKHLATIYESQIKFCYGGAFLGLIIGVIAINGYDEISSSDALRKAYAINLLVLFYAGVINEGVLRPLSIKLRTCDFKQ